MVSIHPVNDKQPPKNEQCRKEGMFNVFRGKMISGMHNKHHAQGRHSRSRLIKSAGGTDST